MQSKKDEGLEYLKDDKEIKLTAYVDASHGGANDVGATTGYAIYIGKHLVQWKAKKQAMVHTSSCSTEIVAAEKSVK